jgi:hypothetical protein
MGKSEARSDDARAPATEDAAPPSGYELFATKNDLPEDKRVEVIVCSISASPAIDLQTQCSKRTGT